MTKEEKNTLLTYIKSEVQKAKENAAKADEASKFIVSGPSQSGDKYHAQNAADLANSYVKELEKLNSEINGVNEEIAQFVKPISHVEVKYDDGNNLDFYFVEHAASLTKILFISRQSPLGVSIFGKKAGETFSYELGEGGEKRAFSGKILSVS